MTTICFFVAGIPKPAGSKRGFYIEKLKRVVITDACSKSKDWKTDVRHEAQRNYSGSLIEGPITAIFEFQVQRPKGHYRTGRNAGEVRESAPEFPTTKPDALKLARGVEDALTGVIWNDDSQIVHEVILKRYGVPGVKVTITEMKL